MPGYKTHLVGGLALYGITIYLLRSYCGSLFVAGEWLLFALIGSLFPDIDTKSKGQFYFYQALLVVLIILAIQRNFIVMAFLAVVAVIPILARHRGIFHKFFFILALTGIISLWVFFYAPAYFKIAIFDAIFFLVGVFSHLSLDYMLTAIKGGSGQR